MCVRLLPAHVTELGAQVDTLIYLWLRGRDYASIALG